MPRLSRAKNGSSESPHLAFSSNLRRVALLVVLTFVATGLPVLGPIAGAADSDQDRAELIAEPGPPPPALSEADRTPPLAELDEDGVRNPTSDALRLPETALEDASTEGVIALPDHGGSDFDLFAIGDPEATHAAVVYPNTANIQGVDGSWKQVELTEEPGVGWTGKTADGAVRFPEQLGAAPVEVSFGDSTVTIAPIGVQDASKGAVPVADQENTIRYEDALPGTDLVYSLTAAGYKELIVLKDTGASAVVSYAIVAPGLELRVQPSGEVAFVRDGRTVAVIPAPATWDSASPPASAIGTFELEGTGRDSYVLTLTVDPAFMSSATYPVTIDPGSTTIWGLANDDTYVDSANPNTDYRTSMLEIANGAGEKRSFVRFDTTQFQRDDRIVYEAELNLYAMSGPGGGAPVDIRPVTQAWPNPLTWNTQPTVDPTALASETCTNCSGWIGFDVTDMYQHVLQTDIADPWTDYGMRASADGSAAYMFRSADTSAGPALSIAWNDLPSAPSLDKPAGGYVSEDDTPTLKVQGGANWPNDPNGDDVLVQFQISDDPNEFSGSHLVWESPWLDSRSYVVPSGILIDGQTYYWRARSWDICYSHPNYLMCSYTDGLGVDHERKFSPSRSFTVVLKHFGDDERWAMWSHELGNAMTLKVNESNGNLFLDVPLDSLSTPVGDLEIGLSYNSQQDADYGLSRGWDLAIGSAGSMRDLPIDLVKLSDYPNNGLKIRFRGGRTSYFPHRDHRVFATVTGGAGVVRENANGGFIFVSPAGDRYEFSGSGRLLSANPVMTNLASGQNAIDYTYDGQSQLERVTDPLGRDVELVWTGGKLQSITTWAGQTWTFEYNAQNDRLRRISVVVTNPSTQVTRTETVEFSYIVGAQLPGGLLGEIDDGKTYDSAAAGWVVQYTEDTNDNWRVAQLTPPPGGGPQPIDSWFFQYLGEIKGSTAATACVTDPLGAPDTSPPIVCDGEHQTIVDFNWAGLPIRISGPADQTGYWPVRTLIWDSNNNLICRREPAANAASLITGSTPCKNDARSTVYDYEAEAPFRLLSVIDPYANPTGTGDRLKHIYQYDSDTNGANFNGLWVEKYENGSFAGIPADESVWSNFDANWGTGSPPGLTSTDNFSLRWTGLLNTYSWSGSTLRKARFRITSEEGVSLVIGNKLLLDCLGTTQAAGSFNCGTNQDVFKWMLPDTLTPITIEYSDLTGPASIKLEWSTGGSFSQIPASMLQTNLGLLTRQEEWRQGTISTDDYLRTQYTFPDDNAKARHIPDAVAVTDLDTSLVRKTAYTYNTYGQVRTVTTAAATSLAATTTYTYTNADPISCLSSVEEPDGAITNHVCNPAGDVTTTTQIVRAVPGTNHTTQQSRVTTTEYDSVGRVTEVTTPWGGSTTTSYDLAGRPIQVDQYLGTGAGHDTNAITEYDYDDAGHLVLETLPEIADPANPGTEIAPTITHVYDWLDNEVATVDQRGKQWGYTYDAFRRLIATESPSGLLTTTEYRLSTAPSGGAYQHQLTTWTPPGSSGGVPTVTSYDVLGRTTSEKVGTLTAATSLYDVQNRMFRATDPAGTQTNYTFNRFGDTLTVTEFFGSTKAATTTNTYDAAGRIQKVDGPRAMPTDDSISYVYDEQGRLETATQNGITLPGGSSPGVITTYVYNDADERIQVAQPMSTTQSFVRNWTFDPTIRTSTYVDARGTTTSTHDLSGLVTTVADPRGITLNFEYDNQGRRTRRYAVQNSVVTNDQTYGFDLAGNMLTAKVVATATTITSEYDDDGRLWRVYQASYPTPTTTHAYHATTGRLSSITDAAGTTSYAYDDNGLLNDITDPFSATHVIYTYDTAGRITKRTDGSGLCWTQSYESGSGRLDVRRIRQGGVSCNGTIHATFDLGYDSASNVTSRAATITGNSYGGTYTYGYDAANRLTSVAGPAVFGTRTFAYDGASNRTSIQVGAGTPVTTTYDDASLPTSSSDGTSYAHDQVGELTAIDRTGSSNDWLFTYDAWNRLTKSERSLGSADVTYTLDALDRLLSRTSGGSTASYTYQGLGENLASAVLGTTTTMYAHTPGGPLGQRVGSATRYYIRDQHGDLVAWANTSATLVGTSLYDPWGGLLAATGEMANPTSQGAFGFQSDLTDYSTGQVDMLTRLYEPSLGRFSSRDFIFGDAFAPTSLNQFTYGANDPVTNMDSDGACPRPDICPPPPTFTRKERQHWYELGEQIIEGSSSLEPLPTIPPSAAIEAAARFLSENGYLSDGCIGLTLACNALLDPNYFGYREIVESKPIRLGCLGTMVVCVALADSGGELEGFDDDENPTSLPPSGPFKDPTLWERVRRALANIAEDVRTSPRDGEIFRNREGLLPDKPTGYYRRYTIPGVDGSAGRLRLVLGAGGERYFSPSHYLSFFQF